MVLARGRDCVSDSCVARRYRRIMLGDRTANACYKDAADLHAELEDYPQAIALYEQVANGSLSSALTKYSVKEYWLRSSLCALAMKVRVVLSMLTRTITDLPDQDVVTAKRNLSKYGSLDTTFPSTREAKFINILCDAIESGDIETFTGAVFEFDQVTKLDNWKTSILLKIKRGIDDVDIL